MISCQADSLFSGRREGMVSGKFKRVYITELMLKTNSGKKFFKFMSYKNILLTETHLYCNWKRNDNTLIDTIKIILFLSRVTLKVELLGKAISRTQPFDPHSFM